MTKLLYYLEDMRVLFVLIACVFALYAFGADGESGIQLAQDAQAEALGKVHMCASCHGGDGISTAEIYPNLAGQQEDYIVAQLSAFRDHSRQDRDAKAYMWGVAAGLDDAVIGELAKYYSLKPQAAGRAANPAEVALGEKIYKEGISERDIPACASCHGERGEGNGAMPSLAAQHKDYVRIQLGALSSGARDSAIMNPIAKNMTPDEIEAVSAYLSSL